MNNYKISLKDVSSPGIIGIDESLGFPDSDLDDAVQEYMEDHGIEYNAENYNELIIVQEVS